MFKVGGMLSMNVFQCQKFCNCTIAKKVKLAHTRLPSIGFRSWSRFLAVSLQMTWVINPAVGCHYFQSGLQLLVTCYLRLMGYVAVTFGCPYRASVDPACSWTRWLTVPPRRPVVACSTRWQSANWRSSACLTVVRHLGLNSFNECPLSPLVTSASSKNLS